MTFCDNIFLDLFSRERDGFIPLDPLLAHRVSKKHFLSVFRLHTEATLHSVNFRLERQVAKVNKTVADYLLYNNKKLSIVLVQFIISLSPLKDLEALLLE